MNAPSVLKMLSWSMDLVFQLTVLPSITSSTRPAVLLVLADAMMIASAMAPEDALQTNIVLNVLIWYTSTPPSIPSVIALSAISPASAATDPLIRIVPHAKMASFLLMVPANLATVHAPTAKTPPPPVASLAPMALICKLTVLAKFTSTVTQPVWNVTVLPMTNAPNATQAES